MKFLQLSLLMGRTQALAFKSQIRLGDIDCLKYRSEYQCSKCHKNHQTLITTHKP